jgi:hypothetical protein
MQNIPFYCFVLHEKDIFASHCQPGSGPGPCQGRTNDMVLGRQKPPSFDWPNQSPCLIFPPGEFERDQTVEAARRLCSAFQE